MSESKKKVIAPVRERLKKLYEVGREVTFSDENGDFSVWLQKITPLQDKEAIHASYKPRAKVLAVLKTQDEGEKLAFMDTLSLWGLSDKETQVYFLAGSDIQRAELSAQARIADKKEWSENDYLIALQEAWNDGLSELYASDPDDPEAARVYTELSRYSDEVQKEVDAVTEDILHELRIQDDDVILDKVIKMLVEHRAGQEQMAEYNQWRVFYATRLIEDHDQLLFESKDQIFEYGEDFFERLLSEYEDMTMDPIEGKG